MEIFLEISRSRVIFSHERVHVRGCMERKNCLMGPFSRDGETNREARACDRSSEALRIASERKISGYRLGRFEELEVLESAEIYSKTR